MCCADDIGVSGHGHGDTGFRCQRIHVGGVGHPREPNDGDVQGLAAQLGDRRPTRPQPARLRRRSTRRPTRAASRRPVFPSGLRKSRRADESRPGSPRNLLITQPATSAWSSAHRRAKVPNMAANTPPRSMSPTTTTGRPAVASQTHVDVVACPQIDLGRASCSLGDDDVEARAQIVERPKCRFSENGSTGHPSRGRQLAERFSHEDDVRAKVAPRLEEHRIHGRFGRHASGQRLQPLRPPYLRAIGTDHGVVRHVLSLEGRNSMPSASQPSTQSGRDEGLPGVRSRPGDKEAAREDRPSPVLGHHANEPHHPVRPPRPVITGRSTRVRGRGGSPRPIGPGTAQDLPGPEPRRPQAPGASMATRTNASWP